MIQASKLDLPSPILALQNENNALLRLSADLTTAKIKLASANDLLQEENHTILIERDALLAERDQLREQKKTLSKNNQRFVSLNRSVSFFILLNHKII